jgi:hypothetical protein
MSWYSRTWRACGWRGCEAEVLATRAEAAGWLIREGRTPLCPLHRGDVRELDAAERAAGEQGEK